MSESIPSTKFGIARILTLISVVLCLLGGLFYILSGMIIYTARIDSTGLISLGVIAIGGGVVFIVLLFVGLNYKVTAGLLCIIIALFSLYGFMYYAISYGIFQIILGFVFTILGGILLLVIRFGFKKGK